MELLKIFKREYKNLLIIFVIFLLNVFLFKCKMYNLNTDFGREAYFPAIMADGAVLYKDIFNTFICPFSYLFNAILIKLFGHSLNVLFITGAANAFAITGGIYLLSREFLNKAISMAIALFIILYSCFYTGLMNYTIGQRRGVGLSGSELRHYVCGKNVEKNILYVAFGDSKYLYSDACVLDNINLLGELPKNLTAKFRYRGEEISIEIESITKKEIKIKYPSLAKSVTPGQACVFYHGDECLGCGFIKDVFKNGEKLWYLS